MRKRHIREAVLIIVLSTLLFCFSLPPAPATGYSTLRASGASESAPLSEHFGVVSSHLILTDPKTMQKQIDALAEAGIKWVRCSFAWTDLERKRGIWDFSKTDLLVGKAAERGVKILGILGACPPWANGGKDYRYPPTDIKAWRYYVSTVCSRYKGRINAWEIWNEENISYFWRPKVDPKQYVQLLGNASMAIRKADPGAKVIFGGVAGLGQWYLNACFAAGAANYIDAIAYHPYSSEMWGFWYPFDTRPNEARCRQVLQEMRSMISRYTNRRLEIWLTELGWNTGGWWGTVDQKPQAAYMLRTLISYASQGVDKVFYYSLWDEFPWTWWPDHCGLLKNDFNRKDAFYYCKTFEQFFGKATSAAPGAILSTSCANPSTLEVHPFELPDGSLVIAAWKTDNLYDTLTLTVRGSSLETPLGVNPLSGAAASVTGSSRDASGDITVSNIAVGKTQAILEFGSKTVSGTGTAH